MLLKNKEEKLCKKFDIDQSRYAVCETENHGHIVLEELDIKLDIPVKGLLMKKLIAYKLQNEKTMGHYSRDILGEIDMELSTKDDIKCATLDGYGANDKHVMKQLFMFLENRAIAHDCDYISLVDTYKKDKIAFLSELGYKSTPYHELSDINIWDKANLEKRPFNKTIKDAYNELKASESENQ